MPAADSPCWRTHCSWNRKSASAVGAENLSPALQGGVSVNRSAESRRDGTGIIQRLTASLLQQLPQHVLQDSAVLVVLHFLRSIDAHRGVELCRCAVGLGGAH